MKIKEFIIDSLLNAWNVFLVIIGVMSVLVMLAMFLAWQTPEVTEKSISDFYFFIRLVILTSLISGIIITLVKEEDYFE